MNLDQIRTAQTRIHTRCARAVRRIAEIESGHTQRMLDFAAGIISGEELDTMAAELPKLREIANEDNTAVLERFAKLEQDIHEQNRMEQRRLEAMEARRQFADNHNRALASTTAMNLPQIEELAHMRPGDFPGTVWHRFTNKRLSFAARPESNMTFGEFTELEPYDPEL